MSAKLTRTSPRDEADYFAQGLTISPPPIEVDEGLAGLGASGRLPLGRAGAAAFSFSSLTFILLSVPSAWQHRC